MMAALLLSPVSALAAPDITLQAIGTYSSNIFNSGGAEIVAHDPLSQRLFVVNVANQSIDVLGVSNPASPSFLFAINLTAYGHHANSVAVKNGVVAVAVEAAPAQNPGKAVFFNTDGTFLSSVQVGAIPDMLVFTPDGEKVLVANEAEPSTDYLNDPEGSVSIIDLRIGKSRFNYPPFQRGVANITQADVTTAGFAAFNSAPLDSSIRIFGVNATVAKDLEPEYITISGDSQTAWVTLQENNAIGILDISQGVFTSLKGLGFKNHQLAGNSLDASDRDGAGGAGLINIANWPVFGMYQPDAIASYRYQGNTYLVTANEGDAREYTALTEERRISALTLDATAFPNAAALQNNAQLGRLNVTNT
ncbi:MAG: choice-of-anchor I family protein, partial [Pyrinomonadaceae bacterium]|nr:choice-of-anchor I family protein [Pyrinomonadaceae bacterium]